VVVVVLIVAAGLGQVNCSPRKKTYRWFFSDGPTGEYVARFMVPGAPALPVEDGFRVVRFPPGTRSVDTGDEYVFGNEYFREEYFLIVDGTRREIKARCQPRPSLEHVRVDARCSFP
jgi:hypothetical protein